MPQHRVDELCGVFANMLGNEIGDGLFCFGRGTIQSTTSSLRGAMDDCMDLPPLSSETKGSLVFRTTGVSSADEGLLCKNGVTVERVIPDLESLSSEPSEAEYFNDEEVEACDPSSGAQFFEWAVGLCVASD